MVDFRFAQQNFPGGLRQSIFPASASAFILAVSGGREPEANMELRAANYGCASILKCIARLRKHLGFSIKKKAKQCCEKRTICYGNYTTEQTRIFAALASS